MLGIKSSSGEPVEYSWWKVAAVLKSRRGAVMAAKVVGRVGFVCMHVEGSLCRVCM